MLKIIVPVLVLTLCFFLPLRAQTSTGNIFPYDYRVDVLDNGLKVVTVPLRNPNIISYYTIVRSGSRNEVEPGKSGFAHFFEHMMFKGTPSIPRPVYDDYLTRLGAGTNGYTTDDYTCYFVLFAGRNNLEDVVKTEADRFINLTYTRETIKTEATVIEGEYNTAVSDPDEKLEEVVRNTAFDRHSYKHTTIGYLKDIQDMPNQYDYSLLYKKRFYAPDNCILLVAGDFDRAALLDLVKKYYGPWAKSNYALRTATEPPQTKAKRVHYAWPSKTLPRLVMAYHGPAYSDEKIDKAALDLLAMMAFAPSSPLYQKLVIEEQKCTALAASFEDRRDPYLLMINAVLKKDEDLASVETQITNELDRLKSELLPANKLAEVKSNFRYSFADRLETTDGIAGILAFYINLATEPGTLNKLFRLYDRVTPEDIRAMARKYFIPTNSTIVSLTGGSQ
jgi:zinc protease